MTHRAVDFRTGARHFLREGFGFAGHGFCRQKQACRRFQNHRISGRCAGLFTGHHTCEDEHKTRKNDRDQPRDDERWLSLAQCFGSDHCNSANQGCDPPQKRQTKATPGEIAGFFLSRIEARDGVRRLHFFGFGYVTHDHYYKLDWGKNARLERI